MLLQLFFFLALFSVNSAMDGWNLAGKNVLITGGSKGIGKECVIESLRLGANVVTCGRNGHDLHALIEDPECAPFLADGKIHIKIADLSTTEGRDELLSFCKEKFSPEDGSEDEAVIDCLVNNVGFNIRLKAEEFTEEQYRSIMQTNLDSAFFLSQKCYPFLKNSRAEGGASIVNMGSVAGGIGIAMKSGVVYAMTKAAMNQMTMNMACEWAPHNIRVNAISPWYIKTPLVESVLQNKQYLKEVLRVTPMARIGNVQEVSAVCSFLMMDKASYVTGQCIGVDGGFSRAAFF